MKINEEEYNMSDLKPIAENFSPNNLITLPKNTFRHSRNTVLTPLVTFDYFSTGKRVLFNAAAAKRLRQFDYIQYSITKDGQFLVMNFSQESTNETYYKVNHQRGSAATSGSSAYEYLIANSDSLNLNAFKYRFELQRESQTVYFIDLTKPTKKIKHVRSKNRRK